LSSSFFIAPYFSRSAGIRSLVGAAAAVGQVPWRVGGEAAAQSGRGAEGLRGWGARRWAAVKSMVSKGETTSFLGFFSFSALAGFASSSASSNCAGRVAFKRRGAAKVVNTQLCWLQDLNAKNSQQTMQSICI